MARVDPSLLVDQFEAYADVVPLNTYYQVEEATSWTTSSVTFYITTPGANMLLDPEVLLDVDITVNQPVGTLAKDIYFRNQFADNSKGLKSGGNIYQMVPRQGYLLQRAMSSISITLNGQVITCQPHEFVDALQRLYFTQEESRTIMTTSGGAFDNNTKFPIVQGHVTDGKVNVGAGFLANTNVVVGYDAFQLYADVIAQSARIVQSKAYLNEGANERYEEMLRYQRTRANYMVGAARYDQLDIFPDDYKKQIVEPLQCAPFYSYPGRDSKRSIPHVDSLTISINFNPQLLASIFQTIYWDAETAGPAPITLTSGTLSVLFARAPKLHLKWFVPPASTPLQDVYNIPMWIQRSYQNTVPTLQPITTGFINSIGDIGRFGRQTSVFSYNNLRLEQWPDLMLIYIMKDPFTRGSRDPSEHFCGIRELEISVDGIAGKLLSCSAQQLYHMWLRNMRHEGKGKANFEDWFMYGCVIPLRPADLGLTAGPGVDHPVTIHIRGRFENCLILPNDGNTFDTSWHADPTAATTRILYVQAMHERYSLRMARDGRSRLNMLKLPMPGTPAAGISTSFDQILS